MFFLVGIHKKIPTRITNIKVEKFVNYYHWKINIVQNTMDFNVVKFPLHFAVKNITMKKYVSFKNTFKNFIHVNNITD